MFRERIAQLINNEPDLELAGEAENADDALRVIRETAPDLVLVDLTLQDSSGLVLIKTMRGMGIEAPVLVLSMHEESLYAERAIRAGARGYITKHRAASEVVSAIRHVLDGEVFLSSKATSELLRTIARSPRTATPQRSVARLTDREMEVLQLIGKGHATREIAQILDLGIASVDTYRARIKEKMNLRNAFELQGFAIRMMSQGE